MPTLRDVAALVGVSVMTVSRVLHDDPRISKSTKARVRAGIRELGYQRNDTAANLRIGRGAGAIGLVVSNLANPFYSQLALGVGEAAERHALTVMLLNSAGDPEREKRLIADVTRRRVVGIIVTPASEDHRALAPAALQRTPVVLVARPPSGIEADCVLVDDFGGTREACGRLIARGHSKLGFVGLPATVWAGAERYKGFRAALTEAGLPVEPKYVRYQESDVSAAESTVRSMLSMADPPTALFAANNRNMIGALRAVGRTGSPTALAGFDDFEFADMLDLPLIVVSYDAMALGREATRLLLDRVGAERSDPPPRKVIMPTTVVEYGRPDGTWHLTRTEEKAGGAVP
jgi:LacI family transcriptional regulator